MITPDYYKELVWEEYLPDIFRYGLFDKASDVLETEKTVEGADIALDRLVCAARNGELIEGDLVSSLNVHTDLKRNNQKYDLDWQRTLK